MITIAISIVITIIMIFKTINYNIITIIRIHTEINTFFPFSGKKPSEPPSVSTILLFLLWVPVTFTPKVPVTFRTVFP